MNAVIPAKADRASRKCRVGATGIQDLNRFLKYRLTDWIPAFAGMTV